MPGIEFVTLGHSRRNNHRQVPIAVFRSVDIWIEHWPTVHGLPPSPPEGLDGYMVVELWLGRRGTGGYEFDVSGVDIDDAGAMTIHVLERPPGPSNPVTEAVEMHLIAVATPRHTGPIRLDLQVEAFGIDPNRGIADVATRQPAEGADSCRWRERGGTSGGVFGNLLGCC